MSSRVDLTKRKFGYLTVVSFAGVKNTHARWNVKCECGKEFIADSGNLLNGNTVSCGSCNSKTHGMSSSSFYRRWQVLKRKSKDVSKEWLIFENFKNDTYDTFQKKYSLRRLDKSKRFSKENCYWSIPNYDKSKLNERILFI